MQPEMEPQKLTVDPTDPPMVMEVEVAVSCAACGLLGKYPNPGEARKVFDEHKARHAADEIPRIGLRPDDDGQLDDVMVKGVTMFRAENMGDWWWLCCYLGTEGDPYGDRICWSIPHESGEMKVTEWPHSAVYEKGSLTRG